jgi:hypothetical protein
VTEDAQEEVRGDLPPGAHFTYRDSSASEPLNQGDVLEKSAAINELLGAVHPHYQKNDYTRFIVLTQSCDLVPRKQIGCKARYITLAAVRPLSLVIEREIAQHQDPRERAAGLCSDARRSATASFVERLLNNNHPEYFYLHAEPAWGLSEHSCAFLALSIAVRAVDHYETLRAARLFALNEIFQAKLGWLVGNMYSRVGTPDWVPDHCTSREFRELTGKLVDSACTWVDAERLKQAKRQLQKAKVDMTATEFAQHVEGFPVRSKGDALLDRVVELLIEKGYINRDERDTARRLLGNDPSLQATLRRLP